MTKRVRDAVFTAVGLFPGLGVPQQPSFETLPDDLKRKAECTGPRFLCIEWETPGNRLLRKPKPSNIAWREVPSQKIAEALRDRLEEVAFCDVSIHDHLPPPPEAVDISAVYQTADSILEDIGLKEQLGVWLKTVTGYCAYPGCYASATWKRTQWFSQHPFTKRDEYKTHLSCNEHKSKFGFND